MGIGKRQARACDDTARAVVLLHSAVRSVDGHTDGCAACFVLHYVALGLAILGVDTECMRHAADEIDAMIESGEIDAIKERINLNGNSN